MDAPQLFLLLANAVLLLHLLLVSFVIAGLFVIVGGNLRGWAWVNRVWLRVAHLAAIGVVVLQSWFGAQCPLTTLERWLRMRAGVPVQTQGFIEYWVERILFHDWPTWVFTVLYTAFGLLVAAAWWYFPPERRQRRWPGART
jgi:hypothetical protein